jgi:lipid II:glycine glycyltransferase (peptidoglycan interpeptide bridge formation enzyme)
VERPEDREAIFLALQESFASGPWKSIEMRPRSADILTAPGLRVSGFYFQHTLDLGQSRQELFRAFHKDCIQRKIRRAGREAVSYEEGRSETLLNQFYRLFLQTRRRHRLPPQPINWFRNLIACMGDRLTISVVSRDRRPLGSIMTLRHADTLVYKYGASDARFHHLGIMPFLFWTMIQNGKDSGVREIDLGRSNCDDTGLMTFKERLGGARSMSVYREYSASGDERKTERHLIRAAKRVFDRLPDKALVAAGKLFYRHVG